jgi:hypothetical protein
MLHAGAGGGPAGGLWVIWVIWVMVFKLQAGAGGHCLWVIWVIVFLLTQMTQKAQIWRPGNSPALGHLGHFVTLQKSARVELSTWRYTVYIYSI